MDKDRWPLLFTKSMANKKEKTVSGFDMHERMQEKVKYKLTDAVVENYKPLLQSRQHLSPYLACY